MNVQHTPNGPLPGAKTKMSVISSFMLLAALLASVATARAAIYNFQLDGPNTAADAAGNVIAITGSGRFDTTEKTVAASGSFTVYDSQGTVLSKGTWAANKFVAFESYGGLNRGFETGLLQMSIALWTRRGSPIPGILPMTVYCEPGEVPGPAEANSEDGITVGQFTESTGGFTLFQRIGPKE